MIFNREAKPSVRRGCVNNVGSTSISKPCRPYLKYVDYTLKQIPELVIPCHNGHGRETTVRFIPQSMPHYFGAQT